MSKTPDVPKVSRAEATITYSGEVRRTTSAAHAKRIAKQHIERVFDVEHGEIGFIDIVVSELEPHREDTIGRSGRYPFKAEFTLDEGPASYVFDKRSEYVIDHTGEEESLAD